MRCKYLYYGSFWTLLCCLYLFLLASVSAQFSVDRPCFCKGSEAVDYCSCSSDSIDNFNNAKVFPLLSKLLQKDYFKFYKVNMLRPCPYWPDDHQCASKECGIQHCDDEVPLALRKKSSIIPAVGLIRKKNNLTLDRSNEVEVETVSRSGSDCETSNQFDPLDTSLSEYDRAQLRDMDIFEDTSDRFCDVEDEDSADMHYVNLSKNPERYTGYKGNSATKIWQAIYQENCFKPDPKFDKNFLLHPTTGGLCLEKRVFYRLISGLHTAITISIASYNYKPPLAGFGEGTWYRNVEMFKGRFGPQWGQEGLERLKNLYFVYLLELRALQKIAPYLKTELFYTGSTEEDQETRAIMDSLIQIATNIPESFDENEMFKGVEADARLLREEFRLHFMNISRIMDCVGCDKCRLWGKLQTHGMGTALKILFADLPRSINGNGKSHIPFYLTRNDLVALFQSFGRYASSIVEINEFRRIIQSSTKSEL